MLRKLTLFFILVIISMEMVIGQTSGPLLWSQQYQRPASSPSGTPPLEAYNDVQTLSSGNVIAVGYTTGANPIAESDLLIRKLNSSNGAVLLENYRDYYGGEKSDVAIKVLVAEPYFYMIGTSTYSSAPFDKDIVIIKLDTSLNLIWERSINNTGNPNDIAVDAGLDIFGNLYVLGNTTRSTTGGDILLRKYDSNGSILFSKFYTSAGIQTDEAKALAVEPNGVCNITGYYFSTTLGTRLLALKLWSNGAQLWVKYHDVTSGAVQPDEGVSVSYDPVSNDMYVCGRGRNSANNYDWVVVRFAGSDGTKIWSKKYAGTGNFDDAGVKVIYTPAGELYTCGTIRTTVSGVDSKNIQLRKLHPSDGATLWNKTYNFLNGANGPSEETATTMLVSAAGTIYIGGNVGLPTPTSFALYQLVLAYNSSGVQQWAHLQSSGSSSNFQGLDIRGLAHLPGQNILYAAGYKWSTISLISYSTLLKLGPSSITMPQPDKLSNESHEDNLSLSLYPNPAHSLITIQRNEEGDGQIQVLDIQGRIKMTAPMLDATTRLDISSLPAGVYLVRYTCHQRTETLRVIKD